MSGSERDGGETRRELTDGGMNIQNHDGDLVREAVNREEYNQQKALGEVEGHEVLVVARVSDSTPTGGFRPKLTVHVGGEYDDGVYLSGSSVTETFDELWELDEAFGELYREHDLEYVDGGNDGE